MGFFTSSSKFFMYLLTSIFMLLGLAVLAAGLYMRFDTTQWDDAEHPQRAFECLYLHDPRCCHLPPQHHRAVRRREGPSAVLPVRLPAWHPCLPRRVDLGCTRPVPGRQ